MLRQGGVMYFIYPFDKGIVSDYVEIAKELTNKNVVSLVKNMQALKSLHVPHVVTFQKGRNPSAILKLSSSIKQKTWL